VWLYRRVSTRGRHLVTHAQKRAYVLYQYMTAHAAQIRLCRCMVPSRAFFRQSRPVEGVILYAVEGNPFGCLQIFDKMHDANVRERFLCFKTAQETRKKTLGRRCKWGRWGDRACL